MKNADHFEFDDRGDTTEVSCKSCAWKYTTARTLKGATEAARAAAAHAVEFHNCTFKADPTARGR